MRPALRGESLRGPDGTVRSCTACSITSARVALGQRERTQQPCAQALRAGVFSSNLDRPTVLRCSDRWGSLRRSLGQHVLGELGLDNAGALAVGVGGPNAQTEHHGRSRIRAWSGATGCRDQGAAVAATKKAGTKASPGDTGLVGCLYPP
jgi:hypothetical protein